MTYPILYLHETAEIGGAEKSLLGLILRLDRRRFTPFFVCGEGGPLVESLRRAGVSTEVLPLSRVRQLFPGQIFGTVRRLRRYLKENAIALIHSNTPRTNFYAGIVGRCGGIPVVWHARNLLSPFHERIDLDRLFPFLTDRIVCVSGVVQERFRGIPKAVTIYSGVDFKEFHPDIDGSPLRNQLGLSGSEVLVGMVGRIGPGKGHEDFLRALSVVVKKRKGVSGVIVGKAFKDFLSREAALKALAGELGLEDHVTFIGFREEMPTVMAALDIFVLSTVAEPFSRSLLEAMACGKAVIATNAGGVPEVVTDRKTGLLIAPRNPEEMADALLFLIDNPRERHRLGKEARLRTETSFSFEAHVQSLESLYLELLSQHKGRPTEADPEKPC